MTDSKKYKLTLEDVDSGMSLSHKKDGYIEVGISEPGVEFSLPISFLETFIHAIGGTLSLPNTVNSGTVRLRLEPVNNINKIKLIKALRKAVSDGKRSLTLLDAKHIAEAAMEGKKPVFFTGPAPQASIIATSLLDQGWACFSEVV